MAADRDLDTLNKTISLMNFLAEVTNAAERNPIRDITGDETGSPDPLIWLDSLPAGVRLTPGAADGVILRIKPPKSVPEPRPPAQVAGWIDSAEPRGVSGPAPRLLEGGQAGTDPDGPPASVKRAFGVWSAEWRGWADEQVRCMARKEVYEELERAAKTLEQQDDQYEFVLGVGLLAWLTPDGDRVYRHLVTQPVRPGIDRESAEVSVSLIGAKRRFEDRELFEGEELYQPDRGRPARQAVLDSELPMLDAKFVHGIENWLGMGLRGEFTSAATRIDSSAVPEIPQLSPSPALLLRPRSQAMLPAIYRRIAEELRQPGAQVPVALAGLITDTEPETRTRWLTEQHAADSDILGQDPLFPLPTNDEQQRVIELLAAETGVVVQGPPGTGKTHTIANLVCALLARGMRVLVTSQKDQALRVLRDKIPPELRSLCVLLAGSSRDSAQELERGIDALAGEISSPTTGGLASRGAAMTEELHGLRSRATLLNNQIKQLREVEYQTHPPVVPGYRTDIYHGALTEIVAAVRNQAPRYGWIPPVERHLPDRPPLGTAEMLQLLRLTRSSTPARRARVEQELPAIADLPSAGQLAELIDSERQAQAATHQDSSNLVKRLATKGPEWLQYVSQLGDHLRRGLHEAGFDQDYAPPAARPWVAQAVAGLFAGHHAGLWHQVRNVSGEATRLQGLINDQGLRFAVTLPSMKDYGIGSTKKLLNDGQELLKYLESGKKMRKTLKSAVQKQAEEFLQTITVDGVPPTEPEPLTAALHRLEAQVAAVQLVQLWNEAGVAVSNDHVTRTLSELEDNDRVLGHVYAAANARETMATQLRQHNLASDLSTVEAVLHLLDAIPAALAYLSLENARNQVNALYQVVASWAAKPQAASELAILVEAINRRDVGAYRLGLSALDTARQEQNDEKQLGVFSRTLNNAHPQLFDMLVRSVDEPVWEERLGDLHGAWAWSKAEQYVLATRNADEERKLVAEFEQVDTQISKVTAKLAGNHALDACVSRVTDNQARALRTYREMMGHVGLGGGSKTREYRRAARQALEKAKDAVPAWVVPLSGLLENITAARNSFDVIIVDEASQVGLEQLFLLWMAPRVIVVGDDRQCTPGESRLGKLGPIFDRLKEHLGDIDESIRNNFTSKSNLYGLLSARSGKNSVVRLREHFRCVPEIINWSSTQFYGDAGVPGLVALRERKATDLKPLQVVHVEDGETTGHNTTMRNLPEARRIVAQMVECLADPQYRDKTFGVVVLQGIGQVKLLEHEINVAISAEEREHRKIRVGTPPDFQGDERDVIFLSMVVTGTPRIRRATPYQQAYNVAASRAKDQMWLFTSVRHNDLKPDDLRGSLLGYMEKPPSVFGKSPALEEVSEAQPHEQFDSLFEQRVFREIRGRGYFVVPQYKVGTRSLDLVVVGDGGRLAIECDGHHWHTSVDQQVSDARRDRELHRMKWDVLRIRESEFEFDKDRELAKVWQRLEERQIHPGDIISGTDDAGWSPVALDDDDATNESDEG